MKKRIIILFLMFLLVISSFKIAYSLFHSKTSINTIDQHIAKFVFDTEKLDHIELPITDLKPGDNEEYKFTIKNNKEDILSNVMVNYQVTIKTFHFMPLSIELYKEIDGKYENIMTCDESYSRNSNNELVCNSPILQKGYTTKSSENFKLKVSFDVIYNSMEYANLVDYLDIEVKSWQNTTKITRE